MGICRKNSKNKNKETHLLAGGQWTLLEERRGETRNKYTFSIVDIYCPLPNKGTLYRQKKKK